MNLSFQGERSKNPYTRTSANHPQLGIVLTACWYLQRLVGWELCQPSAVAVSRHLDCQAYSLAVKKQWQLMPFGDVKEI